MKDHPRLPESELDIMLAVWEAGEEGATAPGILEGLARPLTASALHSYLKRLEDKTYILGLDSKTDMRNARKVLGPNVCLLGDVPCELFAFGTPDQVADYVTRMDKLRHPYDAGIPARMGIEQ